MNEVVGNISEFAQRGNLNAWIMAAIVLVITTCVSHALVKLVKRLSSVDGIPLPSSTILVNTVRIVIWALELSMLSACFGVDVNGIVAALGIGGVALSLGLQDTIKNFIGGVQVTLMKIVKPGDHIIVGGVEGIVQDVSWRQTVVKDYENVVHLIPNAVINAGEVSKVTPENLVSTMLSFTTDTRDLDATIREMELLAKRAVEEVAELEKDPWILLTQIGEYGTWAKMRFVLKDVTYAREARDAALRAVSIYTRVNASEIPHVPVSEGREGVNNDSAQLIGS